MSASFRVMENLSLLNERMVKMEPPDEYDEGNIIVIKQEAMAGDDQTINLEHEEYYEYPDNLEYTEIIEENLVSSSLGQSKGNVDNSPFQKYLMICKETGDGDLGNKTKVLKLHLLDDKPSKRLVVANASKPRKVNVPYTKMKTKIASLHVGPRADYPFKCSECDESFEVKSHLVMHELGHEQYRKYTVRGNGSGKQNGECNQVQQSLTKEPKFKCKVCSTGFQDQSYLVMHEKCHENKQFSRCMCRDTKDLCKCFVRTCRSCSRLFFASHRHENWSHCIKCFYINNSNLRMKMQPERPARNGFKQKVLVTKKLCYSCGKMRSNVSSVGISWLCYTCWDTKLRRRGFKYFRTVDRSAKVKSDCKRCTPGSTKPCFHVSSSRSNFFFRNKEGEVPSYVKHSEESLMGQHFLSCVSYEKDMLLVTDDEARDSSNDEYEEEYLLSEEAELDQVADDNTSTMILCERTGKLIDPKEEATGC